MQLDKDIREFVELLDSKRVEYLLVGGYAVAAHGHPRLTADIDFWLRATPENARRVVQVLEEFGFGSLGLVPQDFLAAGNVVQLGHPPNRIDLLSSVRALEFEAAWAERVSIELDGLTLPVLSLEQLLRNKRAVGRLKDLADAAKLESVRSYKPPDPR